MGTRLRNLKKSSGKKVLSDEKTIGGRGRLTGAVIDELSTYYGKALRANKNSVEDMTKAIWITYNHKASTDANPQHHLCPKGVNSWCQWQKAKALKRKFQHTNSLDLSRPELLEKCLGGFTQNNNESFNGSVWKLLPKASFSGIHVFKIGVYIVLAVFNDGRSRYLDIMKEFGLSPGPSSAAWVQGTNQQRIFHAERRAEADTIEARTSRRKERLQLTDVDSYASGAH